MLSKVRNLKFGAKEANSTSSSTLGFFPPNVMSQSPIRLLGLERGREWKEAMNSASFAPNFKFLTFDSIITSDDELICAKILRK